MSKRRVVITGLGIVSPIGNGIAEAWDNAINGRNGIGPITRFDASVLPTRFAGEVKNFNPADWMSAKEVRRMDAFIHFGVAATKMAIDDAGLVVN